LPVPARISRACHRLPALLILRALPLVLLLSAVSAAAAIAVPQANGGELYLERPAQRIVTLSPNLAEGVYAAGAGDRLVGSVEYSEYPPAAARLPRIGDAFRLDLERIVALRPDLVIAWDSGNPRPAVERLRSLGLPVWSVEIREPDGIAAFIVDVGRAAGTEAAASAEAARLRGRLDGLARRYRGAPPVRYFFQIDPRPLYTVNGQHLISRALALCGGVNVFADEPGLAFQASREAVIVADPDVMFAPAVTGAQPLSVWREWPRLKAVQNDALYLLPADEISQATPRFLNSLERACALLDPLRENPAGDSFDAPEKESMNR
jgi:iron complex transport system substrate-binding protein